jgi:anaphase-promoting complex subunit 5
VFLAAHAVDSLFEDELKATCRLALSFTARGKYDEALTLLENLDESSLRVWRLGQYFLKHRSIIKLTRDLAHNNLDGAEELLSQLLQSKHDDMGLDMAFNIDAFHIDLLTRRGDLSRAFDLVESHLTSSEKETEQDIAMHIRLLLLKANLYTQATRPLRGFSITLRAVSLSLRSYLLPLLWQSISALSTILVSLGEFDATTQLLQVVIPRCLECDAAYPIAQMYATLADAYMGLAGQAPKNSRGRREFVAHVIGALDASFTWFSAVEDRVKMREVVAKKAVVMRVMGEAELAATEAARYAALIRGERVSS